MVSSKPLVLVVEDNFVLLRIAQAQLRKYPVEVKVASDGREALRLYSEFLFDLILMDVMMPNMNGLEATRHIREREQETGRHTPVVAVTALADRDICQDAGMDDYIVKPADYDRVLQKWLPEIIRNVG